MEGVKQGMQIEEQVRLAKNGDDEAFFTLLSSVKERLYKIALSYVKDEHEALEAIQETTYRAYTKLKSLKNPSFFHTWLIRILINYCIDVQKRKRKELPLLSIPDSPTAQDALDEKIRLELAIERLKPKYQHIIILKYYQDLTLTEIAELLEKPEGTVKTWLHKALSELRLQIKEEGGWDYA